MKTTLGEFWNSKNVTSLWISGIAGGKTYLQNLTDEGEYCDLHELIDNGLSIEPAWDLSGRVVEDGSWVWDGEADFRDTKGNSYYRMQVFVSDEFANEAVKNSDAYNTGFEAANQGESRTDNPYAKGTWESEQWFAGWDAN